MKHYNVFSYPDLFEDNLDSLSDEELTAKLKGLLNNIPSKPLIYQIAKINFALFFNPSDLVTQNQIFDYWLEGTHSINKNKLRERIDFYLLPSNPDFIFFGKRYILDFYNFLFENYNDTIERRLTKDEILNTFKGYSIIVYISNKKDKKTFDNEGGSNLVEDLQKLTWPFIINQFECNNNPNHIAELLKLYALLKKIYENNRLRCYLTEYMNTNGFTNISQLFKHSYLLYAYPEGILQSGDFYKQHPTIETKNKRRCLQNISIDSEYYKIYPKKNIYYKFLKEKPLFQPS